MTDHLDLEAVKRLFAHRDPHNPYADEIDALISEVERLQANVERKDEVISRAMRLCEQERASMTLGVLREVSGSPTEEGEDDGANT